MRPPTASSKGSLRAARAVVLSIALAFVHTASAASLQVAPTRITIQPGEVAQGLTLSNSGAESVHVQVRVFRWWQENGEDMLEPTDALTVSPPMLQLSAGSEQLIRVVHTGTAPVDGSEASYRVIVDELPLDTGKPQGPGLRFALRYSIPVFVRGSTGTSPASALLARLVDTVDGPVVEIRNPGHGSAQLADLALVDAQDQRHVIAPGLSGYVMPGQTRRWPLPPGSPATGRIEAKLDGEPQARALVPDR